MKLNLREKEGLRKVAEANYKLWEKNYTGFVRSRDRTLAPKLPN